MESLACIFLIQKKWGGLPAHVTSFRTSSHIASRIKEQLLQMFCFLLLKVAFSRWTFFLEEPFPDELKPPLPNNGKENTNEKPSSKLTCLGDLGSKSCRASGTLLEIHPTELIYSSFPSNTELDFSSQKKIALSSTGLKNILQDENGLTNNITSKVCDPCKTNMKRKMDNITDKSMIQPKKRKHLVLQRRFKHIFQDCSHG